MGLLRERDSQRKKWGRGRLKRRRGADSEEERKEDKETDERGNKETGESRLCFLGCQVMC